jgi:hypothetical protein
MDPVKLAMAMSTRFSSKHSKSQFSGGPNENILEYIQEYKLAIREYDLSILIQKDFVYSSFAQALSLSFFYRNNAKDDFTIDDAVNIIFKHYYTPGGRQARVHTYLKSLRFTSFRFDEKNDVSRTLTALTREISKLCQWDNLSIKVESMQLSICAMKCSARRGRMMSCAR